MSEVVMALYRPHPGKEKELEALIQQHAPTLRELELITARPRLTLKSKDGTYLEIMEWVDVSAADQAHEHPAVVKIWEAMATIAEFRKQADLEESGTSFAHYRVVPHLSEVFS